jgi:hypothetical protein
MDIYLKSTNQSDLEKALQKKHLTCNWTRCHSHDQYYILRVLTGYCPTLKGTGSINDTKILVDMQKCVEYYLINKEICHTNLLPNYGIHLFEAGAVHCEHRQLDEIHELTIIASKLYDWLDVGIKFNASIIVL